MSHTKEAVAKKILSNGLTVLIRETHQTPKVSTQLWYNVGSKDEKTGQKGIAHLIEHMIFKGTTTLSESDINLITTKLSGYCNAFTSYDYTGYLFDFPSNYWQVSLQIMADCMQHCTFKQDLLNAEMKAVIQELKMYLDDYPSSLIEAMTSNIFADHPYHYPIIGFKHDLWSASSTGLRSFYQEHYVPNNATLVIVGDVNTQEAFAAAEKHFGALPASKDYKKIQFYHQPDIASTTVTLYRDVQVPLVMLAWLVPGIRKKMSYDFDTLSWSLAVGKSSRLYKKLFDAEQLVTDISSFTLDLFDYDLFYIAFQPKNIKDSERIINLIQQELEDIGNNGLSTDEIAKATKQCKSQFYSRLENNQKQAYFIGQSYLAIGDENHLFNYFDRSEDMLRQTLPELVSTHFSPAVMHTGMVLPLAERDKGYWQFLQEESDKKDEKILSGIKRTSTVEPGKLVDTIALKKISPFSFAKPKRFELPNGLVVLYHHNPNVPKIDISLDLKAKYYYDPEHLQGLHTFMSAMMLEGTQNYTAQEFAHEVESRGMSMRAVPGHIGVSVLHGDLKQGLEFLYEVLTRATFEPSAMDKIRTMMTTELKNYWDDPMEFVNHLARQKVYQGHPYSKNPGGTFEALAQIEREDLVKTYLTNMSPDGAILAIVGNLEGCDVEKWATSIFNPWQAHAVPTIDFPVLHPVTQETIRYPLQRDQVVLCYAGLSYSRKNPSYDGALLFDQIFTGGVLGSMSSRLFSLREQSGLFYTIRGSILAYADREPGLTLIKTIVTRDNLEQAETLIEKTINSATETISEQELREAKNGLAYAMVDQYGSNRSMGAAFTFLERFNLPSDYFDHRAEALAKISKDEVAQAAHNLLNTASLIKIKIGRV